MECTTLVTVTLFMCTQTPKVLCRSGDNILPQHHYDSPNFCFANLYIKIHLGIFNFLWFFLFLFVFILKTQELPSTAPIYNFLKAYSILIFFFISRILRQLIFYRLPSMLLQPCIIRPHRTRGALLNPLRFGQIHPNRSSKQFRIILKSLSKQTRQYLKPQTYHIINSGGGVLGALELDESETPVLLSFIVNWNLYVYYVAERDESGIQHFFIHFFRQSTHINRSFVVGAHS